MRNRNVLVKGMVGVRGMVRVLHWERVMNAIPPWDV